MSDLSLTGTTELIESDRLIVRPISREDVEDYYNLTNSRPLTPTPLQAMKSRDMAWQYLARFFSKSEHFGQVAMDRSGKLLGVIFTSVDSVDRRATLSWVFRPIVDEALSALDLLLNSVTEDWGRRLEVAIQPSQSACLNIAVSLGFSKEANLKRYIYRNGKYHDVWLFVRML